MRKIIVILGFVFLLVLSGCTVTSDIKCGVGTEFKDGMCVVPQDDDDLNCEAGQVEVNGACVDPLTEDDCEVGQTLVNGACEDDEEQVECETGQTLINNQCVNNTVDLPDWFEGWSLLQEPTGDVPLNNFDFSEDGFTVNLGVNQRAGIQMLNLTFEPGYAYEVKFDYVSDVAGKGVFVQLQGHSGNQFTEPGLVSSNTVQTFSRTLAYPPTAPLLTNGWLTIEITPSGVAGSITISNIELIKTALPECDVNYKLKGTECVPDNNGFIPNGTPTAWFDNWSILTVPAGNKDVTDLEFSEIGYTVYLDDGERSGIEYIGYVFESGYTYELSFDYTAMVAGRMVWVQMEALGGFGFTNTDTWTIEGTRTFTQTLVVPSTYTPTEPGWIKIELTPGAMDNVTISNITITKTPIS